MLSNCAIRDQGPTRRPVEKRRIRLCACGDMTGRCRGCPGRRTVPFQQPFGPRGDPLSDLVHGVPGEMRAVRGRLRLAVVGHREDRVHPVASAPEAKTIRRDRQNVPLSCSRSIVSSASFKGEARKKATSIGARRRPGAGQSRLQGSPRQFGVLPVRTQGADDCLDAGCVLNGHRDFDSPGAAGSVSPAVTGNAEALLMCPICRGHGALNPETSSDHGECTPACQVRLQSLFCSPCNQGVLQSSRNLMRPARLLNRPLPGTVPQARPDCSGRPNGHGP